MDGLAFSHSTTLSVQHTSSGLSILLIVSRLPEQVNELKFQLQGNRYRSGEPII